MKAPSISGLALPPAHAPLWPRLALGACLCLLGMESVRIGWLCLRGVAVATSQGTQARAARIAARREPAAQLASILAANLFGTALPAAAMLQSDGDVQLVGSLASTDPATGIAMLRLAGDKVVVARAGSQVAEGIVLREVYPDHVVIERAGAWLGLALVKPASGAGGAQPGQWNTGSDSPVIAIAATATTVGGGGADPYTPPGIPQGTSFASRLAMQRAAHPPDLSLVPPPMPLPPDQREPAPRAK